MLEFFLFVSVGMGIDGFFFGSFSAIVSAMKNYFVIWSTTGDALKTFSFCTSAPDKSAACRALAQNMGYTNTHVHAVIEHNGKAKDVVSAIERHRPKSD